MKRKWLTISILLTMLCVITAAALVNTVTLTLHSNKPVQEQVLALSEYIAKLPEQQQEEWYDGMSALAVAHKTNYAEETTESSDDTVYVTEHGARYHKTTNCSGLRSAKSISAVTKDVAIAMDRTPCKLCYPHGDPQ